MYLCRQCIVPSMASLPTRSPRLLFPMMLATRRALSVQSGGGGGGEETEEEKRKRVEWHKQLLHRITTASSSGGGGGESVIPRSWSTTTFSRSGGAGGQHVNKVNTKATLRFHLNRAAAAASAASSANIDGLSPLPEAVIRYLVQRSSYYVASSHALVLSASETRSQAENTRIVYSKLQEHLRSLLGQDVQGETSEGQKHHVQGLIAREKQRTKRQKEHRKQVKGARRSGGGRGDVNF